MLPLFPPNDDMIAFLRACKEAPQDDAPRLIFADYLEENGHPERAQFIRVQCELARGRAAKLNVEELEKQESALYWGYVNTDWLLPWREGLRYDQRRFSRGLVALEMIARSFLSSARRQPELNRDFAWVEMFAIKDISRTEAKLVAQYLKQIDDLRTLVLHIIYGDGGHVDTTFGEVWESPRLTTLRSLEIHAANGIGASRMERLTHAESLANLHTLSLRRVGINDALAERLSDPVCFPDLQTLLLEACQLSSGVLELLAFRFDQVAKPRPHYEPNLYRFTPRPLSSEQRP